MMFLKNYRGSLFSILLLLLPIRALFAQSPGLWKEADPSRVTEVGRYSMPEKFRAFELDVLGMKSLLTTAPLEFSEEARMQTAVISLPMPDGSISEFSIQETYVLAPGLAAKYPQIKTYIGTGITDGYAYARIDFTVHGFHAMILSPKGDVFIDPLTNEDNRYYLSYFKRDLSAAGDFACELSNDDALQLNESRRRGNHAFRSSGEELRTYRLALSCTGEYANKKGGTVSGALSGMTTSINRVSGVYEQEFAIRMQLIENDTVLIFLNSATDPFTNNNGFTMLDQNQEVVDDSIGTANYDIGHVFSTGGGGVAHLGAVCRASFKAQGVTGLSNPVGDAFDIDYVAHEMGHQFGANHTFNCTTGSCGGGNRNASTAFEPGSGSTIMSYAGICGSTNDLQPHSEPFFHVASYDEIMDYVIFDFGADCPVITETDNAAPEVTVGPDYSIPHSTPFRLEGSATDPEGLPVTYMWEQVDKGPAGDWNEPSGQAPCFRSFAEDTVPFRFFPKLSTIISNYPTSVKGEVLPDYGRTLNFRFIARDHNISAGGYTYAEDKVTLTVVSTAGPFKVIYPNTNINWPINTQQFVTWEVNNSDIAPVNCASVDILLSIDGGYTYPYTLATAVPNTGEAEVLMPNDVSLTGITKARIMVRSVGNVFFDISNANFSITNNVGIEGVSNISSQINLYPNPVLDVLEVQLSELAESGTSVTLHDALGMLISESVFTPQVGNLSFQLDMANLPAGIYFLVERSETGIGIRKVVKQ